MRHVQSCFEPSQMRYSHRRLERAHLIQRRRECLFHALLRLRHLPQKFNNTLTIFCIQQHQQQTIFAIFVTEPKHCKSTCKTQTQFTAMLLTSIAKHLPWMSYCCASNSTPWAFTICGVTVPATLRTTQFNQLAVVVTVCAHNDTQKI